MLDKIDELKSEITLTFMRAQNLIISSYFDKSFNDISNLEEVEAYRRKLYNFKDYLGSTDGYTFFSDYYVSKMEQLELKYNALENGEDIGNIETALKVVTKRESKLVTLFRKIKKLIFGESSKEQLRD